jgi:subtilisin family serine protease
MHIAAKDEAIVIRFCPCTSLRAMTTLLESHGLIHDETVSRLIAPYHYFRQSQPSTGCCNTRRLSQLPEILEIDIDRSTGEFLNTGFSTGHVRSLVATSARELSVPGKNSAIIAVIDSGFDLGHPNLNYVDRSLHFNAVQFFNQRRDRPILSASISSSRSHFDASRSIRAHGTAVAGAAAAIRWLPREPTIDGVAAGFPIMPLKVSARPTSAEVAAAINWAVEHGARVINMSFKVLNQPVLNAAIENAWRRGLVLCAAAGNRSPRYPQTRVDFPARHHRVIAVGATDNRGRRKQVHTQLEHDWGSQYGDELDVVAPGLEVQTLDDRGDLGVLPGNYLLNSIGTSIASPQVAGLAALLFGMQPGLTNQEVRDAIEGRCYKLPGYRFCRVENRKWSWNREVGHGSIRIGQSVSVVSKRLKRREGNDEDDSLYELG